MTLRGEICVQMGGEICVQMRGEIQRRIRTNTWTHGVLALISGTGPLSHLKYSAPREGWAHKKMRMAFFDALARALT